MVKSIKLILAENFCIDYDDMNDYEYQSGRYTKKVYSLSNGYYSAGKLPPKGNGSDGRWIEQPSTYNKNDTIWKLKETL